MDDLDRLERRLLQDPLVRAALDARRPAFELATQMIGIRAAAGLTQHELAHRAGMTQPEIARLESGAVVPGWGTLARIFAAVGAKVEVTLQDATGRPASIQLSTDIGERPSAMRKPVSPRS